VEEFPQSKNRKMPEKKESFTKLPFNTKPKQSLKKCTVLNTGKGKIIAGVSSQFYHRSFIIAVLSSLLYHRSYGHY
jgi:hypothetical protein